MTPLPSESLGSVDTSFGRFFFSLLFFGVWTQGFSNMVFLLSEGTRCLGSICSRCSLEWGLGFTFASLVASSPCCASLSSFQRDNDSSH